MKAQIDSPPRRSEIYLIQLSPAEGSEQAGTRPVVVVSRNAINHYSPVIVICPLTDRIDAEVIAAADEAEIAMVFTGMRHFRH